MARTKLNIRPLERVARDMAVRLGVIPSSQVHLDAKTSAAVYMARVELRAYIMEIVGEDDMSPAAQKIRAAMRKM